MINKLKNIISILLLLALLMPAIVKLEHHHEHFVCKAKNEKHLHEEHENCAVCSFEFSVFASDVLNINFENEKPSDKYCNNYSSINYSSLSKYSFLLRAPPVGLSN
jgi:hypothetical protein